MELTAVPDASDWFISSSNFSEEAECCQREGCLGREEVVTAHVISSFPARVYSVTQEELVATRRGFMCHIPLPATKKSSQAMMEPA